MDNQPISLLPSIESANRLQNLWQELRKRGLDGFLIPRADEYQGEYVSPAAQRLAWLTGFTGSAGLAIVHQAGSAIFVDGRYTLAVRQQVDTNLFQPFNSKDVSSEQWLTQQPSAKLGYDPWLHTIEELERLQAVGDKVGTQFIACEPNPIDIIWADRPALPLAPITPHSLDYAGETSQAKCETIGKKLRAERVNACILTAPDAIAWLLNIRGGDVPHAPLPHCFAILYANQQVDLFVDNRKVSQELRQHLGETVTIYEPNQLGMQLDRLWRQTVWLDPKQVASWIVNRLQITGAKIVRTVDPCALPKACKNAIEIAGARLAHQYDGIALTRFLHWLEQHAETIDEIQAAQRLTEFRRESKALQDLSFDTISASGANAAIVHYQATPSSNQRLLAGTLYLIDSGGQYLEGTTDVTRTIAIGTPTDEQKEKFTRVLQGHIRLASCRFPKGTTGIQLDILARHALWQVGLDFDHGTGHGVGSYLSVHEGPQRIAKTGNHVALQPGMIISNEPGYYQENAYGIRIENLVLVKPAEPIAGGEIEMMSFETLTLAPIDLNLIEPSLLTVEEKTWLNSYHQRVFEELAPALDEATREWLARATRALT